MNRANAEYMLIQRIGQVLAAVGRDGTTVNGTNADLNEPIWYALQQLGYGVVDLTLVTDADVLAVATEDFAPFLDLAELRVLESALASSVILVDISIGPRRESLSQLSDRLQKTIDARRKEISSKYGDLFGSGLEGGSFYVSSQEDGENIY